MGFNKNTDLLVVEKKAALAPKKEQRSGEFPYDGVAYTLVLYPNHYGIPVSKEVFDSVEVNKTYRIALNALPEDSHPRA